MKKRIGLAVGVAALAIAVIYVLLVLTFGTWYRALAILLLSFGSAILVGVALFVLDTDNDGED